MHLKTVNLNAVNPRLLLVQLKISIKYRLLKNIHALLIHLRILHHNYLIELKQAKRRARKERRRLARK